MKKLLIILASLIAVVLIAIVMLIRLNPGLPLNALGQGIRLDQLVVSPGFEVALYAKNVDGARSIAVGDKGTVFVGSRGPGRVYALPDDNNDGQADRVVVVAKGLNSPNGLDFRNGSLYVAESNRIVRFDGIEDHLDDAPAPVVVYPSFPKGGDNSWKYLRFGPDGKLYVSIGAVENNKAGSDPRHSTIMRMDPDGKNPEVYALGVRNSMGFDWDQVSGALWFTDNGRDWLGDNQPPDELNLSTQAGQHFGFPYRFGQNESDPDQGQKAPAGATYLPAALDLPAHVAPLGMSFYRGSMFPSEYTGQVFIAEHGSWDRTSPVGYELIAVKLVDGAPVSQQVFIKGWLLGRQAWGRPVDVKVAPDGALLISDDRADVVYRVTYRR